MNIVLSECAEKKEFNAGNKARTDALQIAESEGYEHVLLFRNGENKIIVIFRMIAGCIKTICKANKLDNIFLQYPYYPYVINNILLFILRLGRKIKKYKLCILVHDVVALRNEKLYSEEGRKILEKEYNFLKKFDTVICHNDKMLSTFSEIGVTTNFKVLGPFDYLYSGKTVTVNYSKEMTLVVAGNLSKSKCGYLYEDKEYKNFGFNLYGIDYTGTVNSKKKYSGSYSPEQLIENLEGNFGLVWDGDTGETCSGKYGHYLKYNNPHKFSLFIAAGLPIVTWKDSALASYVEKNKIGICVSSLDEFDSLVVDLKEEQYLEYVKNVHRIREDYVTGKNLKKCLW